MFVATSHTRLDALRTTCARRALQPGTERAPAASPASQTPPALPRSPSAELKSAQGPVTDASNGARGDRALRGDWWGRGGGAGKGGGNREQRVAGPVSTTGRARAPQKTEQWAVGWVLEHPVLSSMVRRHGRDDDPPGRSESSAGSHSRRKVSAGRPTCPATRLGGRKHWRGQFGPGGGVDVPGSRYRNFCKPTRKVRWLAFVHGRGDHDEARTAHRAGEGELIAAHHAARASAGRALRPRHFDADCRGILRTVHTQHRVSAERRGQGTIQPAWGWRATDMSV